MEMIGESSVMQELKKLIRKAADSSAIIYIYGESGTGKELVARAIHKLSSRHDNPFFSFNCAALPVELVENELFGHNKGAFTGAHDDKKGYFENADGGTLVLDEIGDLTLRVQPKLLRVLQENEIIRVGASSPIKIDVRIIVSTNKDLEKEVCAGRFREDLFYRVNVIRINVPALKERKSDIPLLAKHFKHLFSKNTDNGEKRISDKAIAKLMQYEFPGNVRELSNIIQNALVLGEEDYISADDIRLPGEASPASPQPVKPPVGSKVNTVKLRQALAQAFNKRRFIGISLPDIYRFLIQTNGKIFTVSDFAEDIRLRSKIIKGNKKKTAHDYIRKMIVHNIVSHNEGKTNQAGYELDSAFKIGD